jgi:hypothetical protein
VGWGARLDTITGDTAVGVDITGVACHNSGSDSFGIRVNAIGSGTITTADAHGIWVQAVTANATQDAYGVRINAPTGGGENWALYTSGDCYLGGSPTSNKLVSQSARKDLSGLTTGDLGIVTSATSSQGFIGLPSSLREHKTNIEDMGDTSWVYALRPVRFEFRKEPGREQFGLIAEEVEEIRPSLATYLETWEEVEEDYTPGTEEEIVSIRGVDGVVTRTLQGVAYKTLIPILLNEVQKLNKRVVDLEANLN